MFCKIDQMGILDAFRIAEKKTGDDDTEGRPTVTPPSALSSVTLATLSSTDEESCLTQASRLSASYNSYPTEEETVARNYYSDEEEEEEDVEEEEKKQEQEQGCYGHTVADAVAAGIFAVNCDGESLRKFVACVLGGVAYGVARLRFMNIEKDIAGIKTDVKTVKKDIKDIKTDIKSVKKDIKDIKEDIKEVKDDINAFKQDVNSRFDRLEYIVLNGSLPQD